MTRRWIACTLLAFACAAAGAESVDEVLVKQNQESGQQLDQAAEKVIHDGTAAAGSPAVPTEAKALTESQIPVLKDEQIKKPEAGSPWARLLGIAAFVLAFAAAAFVFIKKASKAKNVAGKQAKIEILHQHFLGPKKSLVLVQVAGESILLGVTDHNINMIKPVALIDDELAGEPQEFHGFLDDEFTVEQLTAQKSRNRVL